MRSLIDRIMVRVSKEPNSGCWLWMGAIDKAGYGRVWKEGNRYTHRVLYEAVQGGVRPGLELDHACRVRCCVNPQHLEPVIHKENLLRSPISRAAINRDKTHCPYGHPYDSRNTYINPDGARDCRECWHRRSNKKQKEVKTMPN